MESTKLITSSTFTNGLVSRHQTIAIAPMHWITHVDADNFIFPMTCSKKKCCKKYKKPGKKKCKNCPKKKL